MHLSLHSVHCYPHAPRVALADSPFSVPHLPHRFDFFFADLAYSNLGGLGPDTGVPPAIRYVNVGSKATSLLPPNPDGTPGQMHFDLVVTNRSKYTPYDTRKNGLNGRFAQVNFAANTQTDLRVRVYRSCCTKPSCNRCDAIGDQTLRLECYNRGCCCTHFVTGATITVALKDRGTPSALPHRAPSPRCAADSVHREWHR